MLDGSRSITLMVSSLSRNSPIWKPDSIACSERRIALRGDAERPRAVLVDVELQARHRLQPVVVHVADLRRGAHHVADLAGEAADLVAIGAGHAHLHGPADRRTVEQAVDLGADVREFVAPASRARAPSTRSRASIDFDISSSWAKFWFLSCWSSGR